MIGILLILACEANPIATPFNRRTATIDGAHLTIHITPASVELPPPARDLHRATGSRVQFQNVRAIWRDVQMRRPASLVLIGDSLALSIPRTSTGRLILVFISSTSMPIRLGYM